MVIKIRAFGIAKDILTKKSLTVDLNEGQNIGDLRAKLSGAYPDFSKLRSLAFAINEEYVSDEATLSENDEVIIIPPVSGG